MKRRTIVKKKEISQTNQVPNESSGPDKEIKFYEVKLEPVDLIDDEDAQGMSLACPFCNFRTDKITSLQSHVRRKHREEDKLDVSAEKKPAVVIHGPMQECQQCEYRVRSRRTMELHQLKVHGRKLEPVHECDKCDYTSTDLRGLNLHKRTEHPKYLINVKREFRQFKEFREPDRPNRYYCAECGFGTPFKHLLYEHLQKEHPESLKTKPSVYKCEQCDYTNESTYKIKLHVIRVHSDQYNYQCEICGKNFKLRTNLRNHINYQHTDQTVICEVCGKTCRNAQLLHKHRLQVHTVKTDTTCKYCHREMGTKEQLDEHTRKLHNSRCDVCGKIFPKKDRLQRHMLIHSSEKPFSCKVCNKGFSTMTLMKQHMLLHASTKPYECDICGRTFAQRPGLIGHRKSHPGNHPAPPKVNINNVLSNILNND